jgi:putative transposase
VTFVTDARHERSETRIKTRLPGAPVAGIERSRLEPLFMATPLRHSDPSRIVADARTFFVTSSITDKRNLLQSHRSAELFVRVLRDYRAQGKFRLHEFVVMPDHFHLLLTVGGELSIEQALQFVKGGFAFRAGRELAFNAPVWQKGFSEVRVQDSQAYRQIAEYIRSNPVARHLVATAEEFPYSSAHGGFDLDPVPQGIKPDNSCPQLGMAKAMP